MKYIVEITNEALSDMEQLYNYIAFTLLSPDTAKKQYDHIANAILSLDTFPERFCVIEFKKTGLKNLRQMLVDNYSVFYTINDNKVIVTDVLYSASDIINRLK